MHFTPQPMMETYEAERVSRQVDLSGLGAGVHSTPYAFFRKEPDGTVPWVVSRVCDHAGGQLVQCHDNPEKAICPLHNWVFDFDTLSYSSMPNQCFEDIKKSSLPFRVEGGVLEYETSREALRVPEALLSSVSCNATIRHLTHASVAVTLDGTTLVTDPWYIGECFSCGWWLKHPPKDDVWDILAQADFLYISHNHPDHMHRETLARVAKDKPIIVPCFADGSVTNPLRHMGFTNVIELELLQLYAVGDTGMLVCILPTGDHRDDSALFVCKGDFSTVLTVDCVGANHYVLPEHLTALLTNFAAGASGWPLCFDVLGEMAVRDRIVTQNRGGAMTEVMKYIGLTKPEIYMPYAGYFTEAAPRDRVIQQHNVKNTAEQVVAKVGRRFPDMQTVNPLQYDTVHWQQGKVRLANSDHPPLYHLDDGYTAGYLAAQRKRLACFDIHQVAEYFCRSEFRDRMVLHLSLTDDDFEPQGEGLLIDFAQNPIHYEVQGSAAVEAAFHAANPQDDNRHLLLKARKDSLWNIVYYGLPIEELSIGFQCRINRKPDQYNAAFWKHYTAYEAPSLKRGEDRLLYKLLEGSDEI